MGVFKMSLQSYRCCCTENLCYKKLRSRCVDFNKEGKSFYQNAVRNISQDYVDVDCCYIVDVDAVKPTEIKEDNSLHQTPILQFYELSQESLNFLESVQMINKPIVEFPPLPKTGKFVDKTLVLDLDETLVHSSLKFNQDADLHFSLNVPDVGSQDIFVKLRPFLNQFLSYASSRFEIVVFTASPNSYANKLLDLIDPTHSYIDHRLFRNNCHFHQGHYIKDLEIIGRDLDKIVIIDNSVEAVSFQLQNAVLIDDFYGDQGDQCLLDLIPLLDILETFIDSRDAIAHYYKNML